MNLLDKKLEEKLKLLEEIDKLYSYEPSKKNSFELSKLNKKNNNNSKIITSSSNKKQNKKKILVNNDNNKNNKFDAIYSNFELNKNENAFYYRNYEEMMNYAYTLKSKVLSGPQKEKSKTKKNKDIKNISKQNLYNKVNDNFEVNLIPKKEILVDRLLRYGENIEKKKERIKFENENNFKIMSHPQISDVARSINRDPNKFVERLFYDKYTCDKKKNNKHDSYYYNNKKDKKKEKEKENNNFTYRPSINKKSQEIAEKLESSSKRLLRKKEKNELMNKEECEKIAINNYKNLFNNNCFNKGENKKINFNEKNLIYKLYNKGLEKIKKKELIYQENVRKKNEEYKNYSFSPNISPDNKNRINNKNIKYNYKIKSKSKLKELNKKMYNDQVEWQKKKNLENSKKKLIHEDFMIKNYCTFKPKILHKKLKDNEKIIKLNLKTSNSYIEKRRNQLKQKKEKNRSFNNKNPCYSLREFFLKENNNNNNSYKEKRINTNCPYINNKRLNLKKSLFNDYKKNSMSIVIPPNSQRIFCYYDENGSLNNSVRYNNFNNINYSKINFFEAINALHNEIDNLNI